MILVDLDNCLADDRWRRIWLPASGQHASDEAWHRYHEHLQLDSPKNLHVWQEGAIIFTARPERYRVATRYWLATHNLLTSHLYMRADQDHRPSVVVKRALLVSLPGHLRAAITMAYDDREDIVAMYREQGLQAERLSIDGGADHHFGAVEEA